MGAVGNVLRKRFGSEVVLGSATYFKKDAKLLGWAIIHYMLSSPFPSFFLVVQSS